MRRRILFTTFSITIIVFFAACFPGSSLYLNNAAGAAALACSSMGNKAESSVELCFLVKKDNFNMQRLHGIKGSFGLTDISISEDLTADFTLYLWSGDILGRQLTIVVSNSEGTIFQVPGLQKITKDGHGFMLPEMYPASNAREQVSVKIPKAGTWLFSIYIEDKLLGSVPMIIRDVSGKSKTPGQSWRLLPV